MNELKIFNNDEFGQIRTLAIENEPWFVGKDVADVLGYTKLDAMYRIVESEDKTEIDPQNIEIKKRKRQTGKTIFYSIREAMEHSSVCRSGQSPRCQ